MDDIGENLQRRSQLDCKHELADDLACARRDHGRADQHSTPAIADQFQRASMEVVDVPARGLGGISIGDGNVYASRPRRSF